MQPLTVMLHESQGKRFKYSFLMTKAVLYSGYKFVFKDVYIKLKATLSLKYSLTHVCIVICINRLGQEKNGSYTSRHQFYLKSTFVRY